MTTTRNAAIATSPCAKALMLRVPRMESEIVRSRIFAAIAKALPDKIFNLGFLFSAVSGVLEPN